MSSKVSQVSPGLRRLSTLTCVVALLPIGMGALVTTLKAGMAFADWPSSDGHNMLLYPWFRDFATRTDKFVEHGHRLAGMLIGLVSIALCIAAWRCPVRKVRLASMLILVAVIGQGLLGGARVLLDKQLLAMLHSISGALFFSCCVVFRFLISSRWTAWLESTEDRLSLPGAALSVIAPVAILAQYILGGVVRHMHNLTAEHVAGAAIVSVVCLACSGCLLFASRAPFRLTGAVLSVCLLLQVALGLGSWILSFGWDQIGYVAVMGSPAQAIVCSLHTVVGMSLLSMACCAAATTLVYLRSGRLSCAQFGEMLQGTGGAA